MAGTRFRSGQLAALRAVAGLRRVRLAELVEVRESTVGQWERGAASPSAGKVPRLAHALGVPPLQLYEVPPGEGPPRSPAAWRRWRRRSACRPGP